MNLSKTLAIVPSVTRKYNWETIAVSLAFGSMECWARPSESENEKAKYSPKLANVNPGSFPATVPDFSALNPLKKSLTHIKTWWYP